MNRNHNLEEQGGPLQHVLLIHQLDHYGDEEEKQFNVVANAIYEERLIRQEVEDVEELGEYDYETMEEAAEEGKK